MTEETKTEEQVKTDANTSTDDSAARGAPVRRKTYRKPGGKFQKRERPKEDGKMSVLGIRRVTKVTKGAKRMLFSVCVVVGDTKGKVGIGLGKGRDVNSAIMQATTKARKIMLNVSLRNGTIPYEVTGKFCKSIVLLRNAPQGTGVKAGNVVRAICACLGVQDIVTKVIGSRNILNVAHATMVALTKNNRNCINSRVNIANDIEKTEEQAA